MVADRYVQEEEEVPEQMLLMEAVGEIYTELLEALGPRGSLLPFHRFLAWKGLIKLAVSAVEASCLASSEVCGSGEVRSSSTEACELFDLICSRELSGPSVASPWQVVDDEVCVQVTIVDMDRCCFHRCRPEGALSLQPLGRPQFRAAPSAPGALRDQETACHAAERKWARPLSGRFAGELS